MMPIFEPDLMRRSVRETTEAASRPAVPPDRTAREKSAHCCTRRRATVGCLRLLLAMPQSAGQNATIIDLLNLMEQRGPYLKAIDALPPIQKR